MHSSRMCTARLLTYPGGGGGGSASRGVWLVGSASRRRGSAWGVCMGGLFIQGGSARSPQVCLQEGMGRPPPAPLWTEWHTGVKTLPCPKLPLRAVKIFNTCINFLLPSWHWHQNSFKMVNWISGFFIKESNKSIEVGKKHWIYCVLTQMEGELNYVHDNSLSKLSKKSRILLCCLCYVLQLLMYYVDFSWFPF